MIPREIEDIILDYYWSHKIYEQKRQIHYEMRYMHTMAEMKVFFDIWATITIPVHIRRIIQRNH